MKVSLWSRAGGRIPSALWTAIAAVVFLGLTTQSAWAHFPIVAATVSCGANGPVISYTVTSWDPGTAAGSIASVDVLFNGVQVAMGPLLAGSTPPDQFSGALPAPAATDEVDVQAVPAFPYIWGDGGAYSTPSNIVSLAIPANCAPGTGRFTGGGKEVVVDVVTVTYGFEVDCDLHQPSNNLEINWGGNQFHMEDFTSAVCTLQGNPKPPKAPVNTIVGTGTGRYDGMEGYTVVFELQDNGEPSTNDQASFMVYQTGNPANVVLNVPLQLVTSGNIQAHVDQQ